MSDHLPECPMLHEQYPKHPLENCDYCEMIVAAERRFESERRPIEVRATQLAVQHGFEQGVQAARDAVAAIEGDNPGLLPRWVKRDALAAIDNLITKNSGENYE